MWKWTVWKDRAVTKSFYIYSRQNMIGCDKSYTNRWPYEDSDNPASMSEWWLVGISDIGSSSCLVNPSSSQQNKRRWKNVLNTSSSIWTGETNQRLQKQLNSLYIFLNNCACHITVLMPCWLSVTVDVSYLSFTFYGALIPALSLMLFEATERILWVV